MNKPLLILASQSIGRKTLLETLKIPFSIMPSDIDEELIIGKTPEETIHLRAKMKGEDIVEKIKNQRSKIKSTGQNLKLETEKIILTDNRLLNTDNHNKDIKPDQLLVLSADSGAVLDGKIYGKPKDLNEAKSMLGKLSGREHTFITVSYIILLTKDISKDIKDHHYHSEVVCDNTDISHVTFNTLTQSDIDLYLSLTDYERFAGSYALFTSPQFFISKIEGSISSVVGLPLEVVIPVFRKYELI
jgi:MAF protein